MKHANAEFLDVYDSRIRVHTLIYFLNKLGFKISTNGKRINLIRQYAVRFHARRVSDPISIEELTEEEV